MIPSPSTNALSIFGLKIHAYGILIALGIFLAYQIAEKRAQKFNISKKDLEKYVYIALGTGIIGARTYHVLTNTNYYSAHLNEVFSIWNGGLGIIGGILFAATALYIATKKDKISFLNVTDLFLLVVPLAQSIGRWGNYFNQELFGKPTNLPWALEIAPQNRPLEYKQFQTFHPTFLYESILNLINFLILYKISNGTPQKGIITAVYLINYGLIRLFVESIKIDPDVSSTIGILRVPQYASLILITGGILLLIKKRRVKTLL